MKGIHMAPYLWGEVPHSLKNWLAAFIVLTALALGWENSLQEEQTKQVKRTGVTWVLLYIVLICITDDRKLELLNDKLFVLAVFGHAKEIRFFVESNLTW